MWTVRQVQMDKSATTLCVRAPPLCEPATGPLWAAAYPSLSLVLLRFRFDRIVDGLFALYLVRLARLSLDLTVPSFEDRRFKPRPWIALHPDKDDKLRSQCKRECQAISACCIVVMRGAEIPSVADREIAKSSARRTFSWSIFGSCNLV